MLLATGMAIYQLGWDTIFDEVQAQMGVGGFDPLASPAFGPEYVAWQAVLGLVGCAVWPTAIARALAMESSTAVKRQFTWSSIAFAIRLIVPCFWGICAFVFVTRVAPELGPWFGVGGGELEPGQEPINALYAMPVFMGRLLPVGIVGLVSAAMIAAFMSTHDSYLLCWSSVIVQDVIAPLRREPLSIAARVRLTRVLIVVIGGYIWAWGLFYEGGDDIWDYMAITGAIYFTGAFALLIGGLYWRRASSSGAFCALLAGCSAMLGLGPIRGPLAGWMLAVAGRPVTEEAAEALLSSARVGLFSVAFTMAVFVIVSLLMPDHRPTESQPPACNEE
jgi:SSS family solute:Na+ symporter